MAGPELADDVQDGVATVVVQDSPQPPPVPPPGTAAAEATQPPPVAAQGTATAVAPSSSCSTCPSSTSPSSFPAGAQGVPQVFRLFIVQDFPLLVDGLPALEYPVHRRPLMDDEA